VVVRLAAEPLCSGGLANAPTSQCPWKVLSQQAIGILVRPALPRTLRTKIDIDVGRQPSAATRVNRFSVSTLRNRRHAEALALQEHRGHDLIILDAIVFPFPSFRFPDNILKSVKSWEP
jgi:hypothetical protein